MRDSSLGLARQSLGAAKRRRPSAAIAGDLCLRPAPPPLDRSHAAMPGFGL